MNTPSPACGCNPIVTIDSEGLYVSHQIDYCPLHAAAPELLEIAKFVVDAYRLHSEGKPIPTNYILDKAKAAITVAERGAK